LTTDPPSTRKNCLQMRRLMLIKTRLGDLLEDHLCLWIGLKCWC